MISKEQVLALIPCEGMVEWLQDKEDMQGAWESCDRGDWLLWLAGRAGLDQKKLVRAAIECAVPVLQYIPIEEQRPSEALKVVLRWCKGRSTSEEVINASYAVSDAAYATAHDTTYASDAAYAIANATAIIISAASHAANAAAYTAIYAAYTADDVGDGLGKSLQDSANTVRQYISWADIEVALHNS